MDKDREIKRLRLHNQLQESKLIALRGKVDEQEAEIALLQQEKREAGDVIRGITAR